MRFLSLLVFFPITLFAHVNSPDVFFEGNAGPYPLNVAVRLPDAIPGIARIEIRSSSAAVNQIQVTALRINGPGAELAPKPDVARQSKGDPQFFVGDLWLMLRGSWQVRIDVDGESGHAELSVPVPAMATHTVGMEKALECLLIVLAVILSAGLISLVGAAVGEATVEPGGIPSVRQKKRSRAAMVVATSMIGIILYAGNSWWKVEAAFNAQISYKLPVVAATVDENRLILRLQNPNTIGWAEKVRLDDFIPDHDHILHLFLVKIPEMDSFFHLHPEQLEPGVFEQSLPSVAAGRYQLYADVVHATGLPETFVGEVQLPGTTGNPLSGDDSAAMGLPLSKASTSRRSAGLSDGGEMVWLQQHAAFRAREPIQFQFLIKDPDGNPAGDLEPYMGMQGHAEFVRSDRLVFAHVHPGGTVSMAALALVGAHTNHIHEGNIPPVISFLYGFPQPGLYRVFVQVKRRSRVDTGIFDVQVQP
jgi:hypothetical protein